jgi:hypothetical protein
MTDVRIPYTPRPWGLELHCNSNRFRVIVAHRGCGKTHWAVNELIRAACTGPDNAVYLYIMPKANQARRSVFDHVQRFVRPIPGSNTAISTMTTTFPNGSKLLLLGQDDPDSIRGLHVHGIVLDEVDDMSDQIWDIVRPTLQIHRGFCVWIGTPKGHGELYKRYMISQDPANDDWYGILLPWFKTGVLDEIDNLKREMSPEMFAQELEVSFEAALVGAYYGRATEELRENGRIAYYDPPLYREDLLVHTAWDLGVRDHTAVWFYQLVGDQIHFVDYEEHGSMGFEEWGTLIEMKAKERGYRYGDFVAPFDIRNRELGTGVSRLESGARYGLPFVVCPDQGVADGIEMVREALPRCRFDLTRCYDGVEMLKGYRSRLSKDGHPVGPLHSKESHAADSLRYGLTWITQVVHAPAIKRFSLRRR